MSLAKRIIPCLDVTAGRVVKGVNFVGLRDAGDPVRPIVVGHDPDFSEILADLAGAPQIPMPKGALARIEFLEGLALVAGFGDADAGPDPPQQAG